MARRRSRSLALGILFQIDVGKIDPDDALGLSLSHIPPETAAYARSLTEGVLQKKDEIDETLTRLAKDWAVHRMPAVDRNILRIAVYELMLRDVPDAAVIDEAVELAKTFAAEDAPKFVNGILSEYLKTRKEEPVGGDH